VGVIDLPAVEAWIRGYAAPVGAIEPVHVRPWATVLRVPLADGVAWFKACPPEQAFEARLTAQLHARWPDHVVEVLRADERRRWLLLADAGEAVGLGNPPEVWLEALRYYAELQRGEVAHAADHLAHGVPDMRLASLPAHFDDLLSRELPLDPDEVGRLRGSAPRFRRLCDELASFGLPETIQHDDLHHANLFVRNGRSRIIDWGDSSIAHPFASLVVLFRFLERRAGLAPDDPWFARLRDAYLEPWGPGLVDAVELALRVGAVARSIFYGRIQPILTTDWHARFNEDFALVLRRALARM
jgi:hypothetical protein